MTCGWMAIGFLYAGGWRTVWSSGAALKPVGLGGDDSGLHLIYA